eukprot:GILK01010435.1.p1 GENE.GILK01010435.1~~GILK01010435.1.p1  ORF type:complete len:703 (+),score=110.49 GILK01010435.1:83-2191(+)
MKSKVGFFNIDYYGCLDVNTPVFFTRFLNLLFGPFSVEIEDAEILRRRCLLSMNAFLFAVVHTSNLSYFLDAGEDDASLICWSVYEFIFVVCYLVSRTRYHVQGVWAYIWLAMTCPYVCGALFIHADDQTSAALFFKWIIFPLLSLAYVARPLVAVGVTLLHILALSVIQFTDWIPFDRQLTQYIYTVSLALLLVCSHLLYRKMIQELNNTRELFISNISHELRTPLNGIIASIETLYVSTLDSDQLNTLKLAQFSSETLLHLVNDLLEFAQCKNSNIDLVKSSFSVKETVDAIVSSFEILAHKRNVHIISEFSSELPVNLYGDRHRVVQVLTNYLSNALKYTTNNTVTVRLLRTSPDLLRFEVQDQGTGIPTEKLLKLFRAFSRVGGPNQVQGTGLGLFICHQLVTAMGGEVGVSSEEGKGSTFWFTLPIERPVQPLVTHATVTSGTHQNERFGQTASTAADLDAGIELVIVSNESASDLKLELTGQVDNPTTSGVKTGSVEDQRLVQVNSAQSPSSSTPGSNGTVQGPLRFPNGCRALLAEDNPFNQEVASMLLKSQNCQCVVTNNGLECLDTYAKTPLDFSFILMDCQMPVMDGQQATREIRKFEKDYRYRSIPIIGLTADAREGNLKSCIEAGMQAAIIKPIRSRELFETCLPFATVEPPPLPAVVTVAEEDRPPNIFIENYSEMPKVERTQSKPRTI